MYEYNDIWCEKKLKKNMVKNYDFTVMILSFRTDIPGQTVQTQIRPQATPSASFGLISSMVKPHSSNFTVIISNFLGVRIIRKFTVRFLHTHDFQATIECCSNNPYQKAK